MIEEELALRESVSEAPPSVATTSDADALDAVTLFVYGWDNVQPGPLSWAFPSPRSALLAVRTMRNAVEWCIVAGSQPSVAAARATGAILFEHSA